MDATGTTSFLYDADGNRVKRTTPTGSTVYVGGVYEYETAGSTTTETSYYTFGGRTVAVRHDSDLTYLAQDHLGSTSISRNASTGVVEVSRYLPFGDPRGSSAPSATDHTYTGQIADASTDLMFYNARYYDPTIGRFISPDTIVPNPANPQDLNRYTYVRNNPINYTDPSGHDVEETTNKPAGIGPWQIRRIEHLAGRKGGLKARINSLIAELSKDSSPRPDDLLLLNSLKQEWNNVASDLQNLLPAEWYYGDFDYYDVVPTTYTSVGFGTGLCLLAVCVDVSYDTATGIGITAGGGGLGVSFGPRIETGTVNPFQEPGYDLTTGVEFCAGLCVGPTRQTIDDGEAVDGETEMSVSLALSLGFFAGNEGTRGFGSMMFSDNDIARNIVTVLEE